VYNGVQYNALHLSVTVEHKVQVHTWL